MANPHHPGRKTIAALGVYMAFLAFLSLVPMEPTGAHIPILTAVRPGIQNLLHVPAYMLLGMLWTRAPARPGRGRGAGTLWAFGLSGGFGVAVELAQVVVPGRYPSLLDALLNLLGALLGLLLGSHGSRGDRRRADAPLRERL